MSATIQTLEIRGYRGFATTQSIRFAAPSGKRGSGLTVIVGANNAGKSSVIEALRSFVAHEVSFTEGKRNKKAGDRVDLALTEGNGTVRRIKTVPMGGSEIIFDGTRLGSELLVVPPRRHFSPFFGNGSRPRTSYASQLGVNATRSTAADLFAQRLFDIQKDRTRFDEILAQVLKPVPRWYLEQADNGQYYLKFDFGAGVHNSDGAGDGLLSLLFLVDALHDSSPRDAIVVDEPELSLHPSIQRRLAKRPSGFFEGSSDCCRYALALFCVS